MRTTFIPFYTPYNSGHLMIVNISVCHESEHGCKRFYHGWKKSATLCVPQDSNPRHQIHPAKSLESGPTMAPPGVSQLASPDHFLALSTETRQLTFPRHQQLLILFGEEDSDSSDTEDGGKASSLSTSQLSASFPSPSWPFPPRTTKQLFLPPSPIQYWGSIPSP